MAIAGLDATVAFGAAFAAFGVTLAGLGVAFTVEGLEWLVVAFTVVVGLELLWLGFAWVEVTLVGVGFAWD